MRLISCYIENFGTFHHQHFTFEEGLNIYLEDNGWGKTTLAAFLKAMFYGLEYRIRSKELYERPHYRPWQGGPYGGELLFEVEGCRYRISRFWGKKASEDEFLLIDDATRKPSQRFSSLVGEELFGIDRDSFERSIFISLSQKPPTMSDSIHSRLGSLLEDSGQGESYEAAIQSLEQAAVRIKAKRGGGGLVGDWERKRLVLKDQLLSCDKAAREVPQLEEGLAHIRLQIQKVEEDKAHLLECMERSVLQTGRLARQRLVDEIRDRKEALEELHTLFLNVYPDEEKLDEIRELYRQLEGTPGTYSLPAPPPTAPASSLLARILLIVGGGMALIGGVGLLLKSPFSPVLFPLLLISGLFLVLMGLITAILRKKKTSVAYLAYLDAQEAEEERKQSLQQTCRELSDEIRAFFRLFPDLPRPETLGDIPRAISTLQNKLYRVRHLEEEIASLEERLGRDYPSNDLKQDCVSSDEASLFYDQDSPSQIRASLASCDEQLKYLVARLAEQKDLAEKASALADRKEDVAGELTALEETLEQLETRHHRILACMEYLKAAKDRLSTGYMHTMEDSFQAYLSRLDTAGHHQIALDTDLAAYISQGGRLWKDAYLSTGYSDLVHLCLRLALADAMYRQERPFLIMDDPFVNLDAAKLDQAKTFLRDLAGDRQILYFTCHESRV